MPTPQPFSVPAPAPAAGVAARRHPWAGSGPCVPPWPARPRRWPAPDRRSLRRRLRRVVSVALVVALAASGGLLVLRAAWIPVKALVAQHLLAVAWERAVAGEVRPRPWSWADTWPVARLTLPGGDPLVVLAGASGRTLAFGPGSVEGTARPGEAGNVVLAGHRDTHFRALEALRPGDRVVLEDPAGGLHRYRVTGAVVVDQTDTRPVAPGPDRLTLITCWPFDALHPGGPLRYVVTAERLVTAERVAAAGRDGAGGGALRGPGGLRYVPSP